MYTAEQQRAYANSTSKLIRQHIKFLAAECRRLPRKYRWALGEQIEQLRFKLRLFKLPPIQKPEPAPNTRLLRFFDTTDQFDELLQ